ncbi:MAG: YoaK family protein [Gordonia sp. (in: high G+C Gram-positive bacteria)]|uniref:YoaK family protein n=1 Tax=Gordonia sp. (in: high G+C Gram-positive bacteria) TaxID=84139 RepID=UPI003BB4F2FA
MKKIRPREVALAVVLASTAGYLDAVGFVVLGGFFVSFMSGNTTELATGVGTGDWGTVATAGSLVGMFFAGAVLGGVLARVRDGRTTVLAATSVLVGLTAILATTVTADWPVIVLLPLAMGVLNATFLVAGEASIGLTYMTGALVKAGQRLVDAFFGGPKLLWLRHLSLWAALLVGGVIGTLILHGPGLGVALWVAAAALAVITVVVGVDRRRRGVYAAQRERREITILGPHRNTHPAGLG